MPAIYAHAGIADYWIVNLVDRVIEVHRDLTVVELPKRRGIYRSIEMVTPGAALAPLAAPTAEIAVSDLLP